MTISVDNIRSLTDFRQNSKEYVDKLKQSKQPMALTVNGKAELVVQDAAAFQEIHDRLVELENELQQMKLVALQQDIQLGIDEMEAGHYATYTEDTAKDLVAKVQAKGRKQKAQA